jgi:hypothetical protein
MTVFYGTVRGDNFSSVGLKIERARSFEAGAERLASRRVDPSHLPW